MTWREMLPRFNPLHKDVEPLPTNKDFAFCETVTAGPTTFWHIRPLTARGHKFGGGADTPALCGRKVSWDLKCEITPRSLQSSRICPHCARGYYDKTN